MPAPGRTVISSADNDVVTHYYSTVFSAQTSGARSYLLSDTEIILVFRWSFLLPALYMTWLAIDLDKVFRFHFGNLFFGRYIFQIKIVPITINDFEDRIDSYWVYLLWDYRSPDNTVDKPFMNLRCYCTEMIFLLKEKPHDCDSPFKPNDIRNLISFYDSDEKVKLFYDMMDLWQSKEEAKNNLEQILSKERK
jgi:hypothetical protein